MGYLVAGYRMEHEPLHPPISQKMHFIPHFSFRHFNYTTLIMEIIRGNGGGGLVNWKSQGSASSSVVELLPQVFVWRKAKILLQRNCVEPLNLYELQAIVSIILEYGESRKDIEWTRVQRIGLGFVSFAAPQLLFYPFLYAGTRLSTDVKKTISYTVGNRQFNGVIDVFGKTLKSDGIAGLYRGLIISVAETGIKAAVYVGLFPHYLHVSRNNILSRPRLESGVVICYEMAGYPLNTASRRMMLTSRAVKCKGTLHAIAHILTTEGEKSFYSGQGHRSLDVLFTQVLKC
ncbi:hypothetical protein CXB51_026826 [Gossypium anomalum]|uniref:ADP/ATP translocase n=1 Tax=Gossypium anomalum TaxID=47600 RepID=A0A8J6CTV8_9ROSI|nr:hypothetical protein CXB51_026826 [Gossypium anomalum]